MIQPPPFLSQKDEVLPGTEALETSPLSREEQTLLTLIPEKELSIDHSGFIFKETTSSGTPDTETSENDSDRVA